MSMRASKALLEFMDRAGCRPPRCHACEGVFDEGDMLTPSQHESVRDKSPLVHEHCMLKPMRLKVPSKKLLKKIVDEISKNPDWRYEGATPPGSFLTRDLLAAFFAMVPQT